jgi:hypothetical protein
MTREEIIKQFKIQCYSIQQKNISWAENRCFVINAYGNREYEGTYWQCYLYRLEKENKQNNDNSLSGQTDNNIS